MCNAHTKHHKIHPPARLCSQPAMQKRHFSEAPHGAFYYKTTGRANQTEWADDFAHAGAVPVVRAQANAYN